MNRNRGLLLMICLSFCGTVASAQEPVGSDRFLVVISDTHFGLGQKNAGWHPMEDFRWHAEFAAFLAHVESLGKGKTDLVLAGDTFELWQSDGKDCTYANKNFGCTSDEAVARVRRILGNPLHAKALLRLGDFSRRDDNRVYIVPGNHDAALLFQAVRDVVLAAFGANARVSVPDPKGSWLSKDRKILVEHGHQIGRDVNRFDAWPTPFLGPGGAHLQRTWGEQFVQKFYDRYEEQYQAIDNISNNGGVGYGLRAERLAGSSLALGKFLRFYFTQVSWSQFVDSLGEDDEPEWNIEGIRSAGDIFFIDSLPTGDPLREETQAAWERGELGMTLSDLSDDEIRAICDLRGAMAADADARHVARPVEPCPTATDTLGAAAQAVFGPGRDKILADYLRERRDKLRRTGQLGQTKTFNLYIYGHTHGAMKPTQVSSAGGWDLTTANTGAWQRIASPKDMRSLECGRDAKTLLKLPLTEFPSCYPVIVVKPYALKPSAELHYWTKTGAAAWDLLRTCTWKAPACS